MDRDRASFQVSHPSFETIIGPDPQSTICCEESTIPFFHEAGVFIPQTSELFVTSNQYRGKDGQKQISISKVSLRDGHYTRETIFPDIAMGNGGVNYREGVLFCDQGDLTRPGGFIYVRAQPPYQTETILADFMGVPFNSVNDVVIAKDGAIWFTDPIYGFEQGFRQPPRLPSQVYRYDPNIKSTRAVADGFGRPNGIAFSPDEKTIYITDTDHIHGDGSISLTRASSMYVYTARRAFDHLPADDVSSYAFDVIEVAGQPFLSNRRLFAFAEGRAPDGIKCDLNGNVYSGCLDGISVWSPGGVLLGKIVIPGGVANFCFGRPGEIMALNEKRLWRIQLADSTVGALLGDLTPHKNRV